MLVVGWEPPEDGRDREEEADENPGAGLWTASPLKSTPRPRLPSHSAHLVLQQSGRWGVVRASKASHS